MRLTRRYRFSASHRLHSPELSADENRDLYGKCNNPFGHGHNYVLDVTVRGPIDGSGRVADVAALDRVVTEEVLAPLDHKYLNEEVPALGAVVATTENIAAYIRERLERSWSSAFAAPGPRLDRIRIEETDNNFFELP